MPLSDHTALRRTRIAIIGAGMTGLRCDQRLRQQGFKPIVFEKSRGCGGRLATRRVGEASFDHGAQYVTAQGDAFDGWLQAQRDRGAAAVWQPRLPEAEHQPSHAWWVGVPGMASLLKPLAEQAALQRDTTVTSIERHEGAWQLMTERGAWTSPFDIVVITAPAAQSRALLSAEPALQAKLACVDIEPCWALMLAFASPLALDFDAQRFDDGAIGWLSRQGSRPRAKPAHAWMLHASAAWSAQHLEATPDDASALLQRELTPLVGALPAITFAQAHRWRYARTATPLGQPLLKNTDGTLYIGGDWCLGARVEYAYESGSAIAEAVMERLDGT